MINPVWSWDILRSGIIDPRVSMSRTTVSNMFGPHGLLVSVPANTARIPCDQITGERRGLSNEASQQNMFTWCRDMTQADWVKSGISAAPIGQGIDGAANSCSVLTANTAGGTIKQVKVLASGSVSVFLRRWVSAGVISISSDNGASWTDVDPPTSRFQRYSLNQGCSAFLIRMGTAGDMIVADYAQLEASPFPTSPIYTGASPVTRDADNATFTLPPELNFFEGSVLVSGTIDSMDSLEMYLADIRTGGSIQRMLLSYRSGTQFRTLAQQISPIVQSIGTLTESVVLPTRFALCATWSGFTNTITHCLNGGVVRSASVLPRFYTNTKQIGIGGNIGAGNRPLSGGYVERIVLWDHALADSNIQDITR